VRTVAAARVVTQRGSTPSDPTRLDIRVACSSAFPGVGGGPQLGTEQDHVEVILPLGELNLRRVVPLNNDGGPRDRPRQTGTCAISNHLQERQRLSHCGRPRRPSPGPGERACRNGPFPYFASPARPPGRQADTAALSTLRAGHQRGYPLPRHAIQPPGAAYQAKPVQVFRQALVVGHAAMYHVLVL
jgi:hypothetical protein